MATLRYIFWVIVGLALILVGIANRGEVTLRAMPESFGNLLGISPDISLPLFVIIFLGVAAGLLIGLLWEWVREHQIRAEARARKREVDALKRELAELRASSTEHRDDVLALLDRPAPV